MGKRSEEFIRGYGDDIYHSALGGYEISESAPFTGIYKDNHITAFVHDICSGINIEFNNADAIYTETAWSAGYQRFTKNTIAEGTDFHNYIDGLISLIDYLRIPTFLIIGVQIAKMMHPHKCINVKFVRHNADAVCGIWNYSDSIDLASEIGIRDFVCKQYNCILDPCCGYGSLAKNAILYGKKAILSDVNSGCIHYVVNKYGEKNGNYKETNL